MYHIRKHLYNVLSKATCSAILCALRGALKLYTESMYRRVGQIMKRATNLLAKKRRILLISAAAITTAGLAIIIINYVYIGSYGRYVIRDTEDIASTLKWSQPVGIVLGGGIKDGKPKPLLKDRLDTAAETLESGVVSKLIVSGDNRFWHYNEPQVMKNYLVNKKGIDPDLIQLDNAGRSTYETCERARKIFNLDRTVLFSESTHLPRAVYLCRSFGIETYGLVSDGESSAGLRIGQRWREVLARTKASINIYLVGERTILGDKIKV